MRVLQVHPFLKGDRLNPRAGGKSRASLQLTRFLHRKCIDTMVFPFPERLFGGVITYGLDPGESIRIFPTLAFPSPWIIPAVLRQSRSRMLPRIRSRDGLWRIFQLVGLRNVLKDFRPDLVHLHMSHSEFPAQFRALNAPVPLLFTHHTGKRGEGIGQSDFIACISRSFQEELCSTTGFPREKTRVIYCPVSPVFLELPPLPAEKRKGLVFVGGTRKEKGLDILIEAYRKEPRLREHPLHICGTGEEEEAFIRLASENRLPFEFHGRRNSEEVRSFVRLARLAVIPSRSEGFSIALLEALACGTPVVGWEPQVKELEGIWGISAGRAFHGGLQSADELAKVILDALEDHSQTDAGRAELTRCARETFSEERYGEEYLKLYRELVA